MVSPLWYVLGLATLAPLVVGLLPLAGRSLPDRSLHVLLGLTAGLMLGVAFLDLIPEAFHEGGESVATTLGLSFLALYVIEWMMGLHGHSGHEHGEHVEGDHFERTVRYPLIAIAALSVHTFVDGLVLPSAFEAGASIGVVAGIAIALHQAPDGFAAATILLSGGASKRAVVGGVVLVALLTPIGALVGLPLAGEPAWLPHLLALAAGTFIFIAAAELLPELHHGPHKGLVTAATLVGFAMIYGVGLLVPGH